MTPFAYVRATDLQDAIRARTADSEARFIAGGTNLLDLMKENVVRPACLIDITHLPLRTIETREGGGMRLGALATNTDVAYHPEVEARYPLLASAFLAGASPQLRNAATVGGNLLQRTRCYYFYDTATPCNKRTPGAGCSAIDGINRMHAILGHSAHCIATNPSDMCVAMAALDAVVRVTGPGGDREIPIGEFHLLPGDTPQIETTLHDNEIITAVDLPPSDFGHNYTYLKLRDRLSYAFALVSVAAALRIADGEIRDARLALGGVAHKPWRDRSAEEALEGKRPSREAFGAAAAALLQGAKGFPGNSFKIDLAHRAIVRALTQAAAGTPQPAAQKRIL